MLVLAVDLSGVWNEREGLPCESRDVVDAFPSSAFRRDMERESVEVRGD